MPTTFWVVIVLATGVALWRIMPESLRNQIEPTVHAANFTVNTADDHDDGVCNGADCTLREAINAVNAGAGGDTISFSISGGGVHTINVSSTFGGFTITKAVTIDGTTQPGFTGAPLIELNGASAGGNVVGLSINAQNVTVKSLVINRFTNYGINFDSFGNNSVQGCYIGTNAAGTVASGNGAGGIRINVAGITIGGTSAAARNVISGNSGVGINVVSGASTIQGNFVGTDATGTTAIGNSNQGILIDGVSGCSIGGTTAGARNVISGNSGDGILIRNSATANVVQGNFIGVDVTGSATLGNTGNSLAAVNIANSNNNTVGGTAAGAGNLLSGNKGANAYGIQISSSSGTSVLGNIVGLNAAGTAKIQNDAGGIIILGGSTNTIGGAAAGARNVISGNGGAGLLILSDMTQVKGNYFGTDVFGTAALGNGASGILINGGDNNTIGGTTAAERNVVSGNGNGGIRIAFSADNNTVQGNFIGTDVSGANSLSNGGGFAGALIEGTAINNTIGGTIAGAGNLIAFSQGPGVSVTSASSQDAILGNSIFSNSGLGIDLDADGLTANDNCDGDTGANNKQNFPGLIAATADATNTTITGTLNSTASTQFRIEVFTNSSCDPSGNGEGKVFVGSTNVTTDGACNGSFMLVVPNASLTGSVVTATATDPNGNTSEFSACIPLGIPASNVVHFSSASYNVVEACTAVTLTVNRAGDTSGAATVKYATSDVTASERRDYITAIGTLSFAPSETSKTIVVLINDDSYVEGPETFTVSLSNPSAVNLGTPAIATVQIIDNATEPATNVIDDAHDFVCQHYHDFLNREPDSGGLAFWTNEITLCGANQACIDGKRVNVSAAFYLSIEFQQTGYLVERIYKAAYGDANGTSTFGGAHQLPVPIIRLIEFLPDTQEIGQGVVVGQGNWQQQLEDNKNAFTADFVQRSRFTTAFATTLTPAQFVDKLFQNAGVSPSAQDRNTAINEFSGAGDTSNVTARSKALRDVAENAALTTNEFNKAFVLMQYFGYLRRNPNDPQDTDYTGYDFWLTKLNSFTLPGDDVLVRVQNADMVKAFIVSGEYRNRFGP
jgi:CSLREA domain-containing protein